MKKILLATTMLAGTAGFAAAESSITMSGSARMGLTYAEGVAGVDGTLDTFVAGVRTAVSGAVTANDIAAARADVFAAEAVLGAAATDAARTAAAAVLADRQAELAARLGTAAVADATRMEYRTRISITGAGETDSGLSYSATIRLQDASTVAATQAIGVTVSGAFGSLTFGSESSAAEYAVGDLAGVGYVGQGGSDTTFLVGAFALYKYSAGDFTAYVSSGQIGTDDVSIGGSFTTGGLTVGVGHEDNGDVTHTAASVTYAMGDTKIKAIYGTSGDLDLTQSGLSVAQTMGATTLTAYYRTEEVGPVQTDDNFGIGVAHDLGGGAALKAGFESINDRNFADLGLTFSF